MGDAPGSLLNFSSSATYRNDAVAPEVRFGLCFLIMQNGMFSLICWIKHNFLGRFEYRKICKVKRDKRDSLVGDEDHAWHHRSGVTSSRCHRYMGDSLHQQIRHGKTHIKLCSTRATKKKNHIGAFCTGGLYRRFSWCFRTDTCHAKIASDLLSCAGQPSRCWSMHSGIAGRVAAFGIWGHSQNSWCKEEMTWHCEHRRWPSSSLRWKEALETDPPVMIAKACDVVWDAFLALAHLVSS